MAASDHTHTRITRSNLELLRTVAAQRGESMSQTLSAALTQLVDSIPQENPRAFCTHDPI